jgi:hypothetical protein
MLTAVSTWRPVGAAGWLGDTYYGQFAATPAHKSAAARPEVEVSTQGNVGALVRDKLLLYQQGLSMEHH